MADCSKAPRGEGSCWRGGQAARELSLEHHTTELQNRIAKEPDPLRDSPGGRGTRGGMGYIRLVERASWINLVVCC